MNRQFAEKNLDRLFKKYIRLRDGKCVLTGARRSLTIAYYYPPETAPNLRWDERNAHVMSLSVATLCKEADREVFPVYMLEKYGQEELAQMRNLALDKRYYKSIDNLLDLAVSYTRKISALQTIGGVK